MTKERKVNVEIYFLIEDRFKVKHSGDLVRKHFHLITIYIWKEVLLEILQLKIFFLEETFM